METRDTQRTKYPPLKPSGQGVGVNLLTRSRTGVADSLRLWLLVSQENVREHIVLL